MTSTKKLFAICLQLLSQLVRHSLPVVKQFRAIKCIYFRLCYSMHRSHWVHRPSSVRMCTPTVVHWTICTVSAARYKFSSAHTCAVLDGVPHINDRTPQRGQINKIWCEITAVINFVRVQWSFSLSLYTLFLYYVQLMKLTRARKIIVWDFTSTA